MAETTEQQSLSFNGCSLSILLNGLNVLTIDEAVLIKSVLAFIARNENEGAAGEQVRRNRKPRERKSGKLI